MKRVVAGLAVVLSPLGAAISCAHAQRGSTVGGVVRDLHGTPQMGALIELLGPDATVVAQTYTDDHGRYVLNVLTPGQYALRASAAFLHPILQPNLRLGPGARALANLTMTAMVEVGAWFPTQRRGPDEPSDDWRWTLRSAANRPLLRVLEDGESTSAPAGSAQETPASRQISEHLALTAGSGSFAGSGTHQVLTLGLTTGRGQAEVLQADLGQSDVDGEVASFAVHTGLERAMGVAGGQTRLVAGISEHPEITSASGGGLQAFTLASGEKMALGDAVVVDAGTLLSAERLMASRVNAAPFLNVVLSPRDAYAVMYRFASQRTAQSSDDLDHLGTGPELLSDAAGRPLSSNGAHQEIAVAHHEGKDRETLAFYRDNLRYAPLEGLGGGPGANAALAFAGLPVLTDLGSGNFRLAGERYVAHGVRGSWTHELTPTIDLSLTAQVGSAQHTKGIPLSVAHLADQLEVGMEPAIEAVVDGKVLRAGTTYRVGYRWQPTATVDTVDAYDAKIDSAYLSCLLRQKLWSGRRLQGLDAVLEATNLLEEGYQPMLGPDGQTLILAQVARTLQAGLAFSF